MTPDSGEKNGLMKTDSKYRSGSYNGVHGGSAQFVLFNNSVPGKMHNLFTLHLTSNQAPFESALPSPSSLEA